MVKLNKETRDCLLDIYKSKNISLEGNMLKLLEEDPEDSEFNQYLQRSIDLDKETRKKRLDITKQIQSQNRALLTAQNENHKLMSELTEALEEAKNARCDAEKLRDMAVEDLDTLQKRTQFEMIGMIVKSALYIIVGVGLITTGLYVFSLANHYDTKIIESSWSNMFGILLTNSFSIIGTIMGVKYATDNSKKTENK
jgi:hypothetical protein